ncbi:MAG: hypothetical protein CM15mP93_08040 [Thiotrichaceae bacterium]|nr:MAG: hypothetical protein CM15mP93_08040 [Thiotrichaceae bacterium]
MEEITLLNYMLRKLNSLNNNEKQIIAIGGGGFGRNPGKGVIEQYILNQTKKKPKICFIPTATGDDESYKVSSIKLLKNPQLYPHPFGLFKRTPDIENLILKQDIIFVGGGNTKIACSCVIGG